ncbi:MAG TPA: hypothetical protein VGO56_20805 [Pyrinomonadaceae bacterium]|jgi:hypothetical protein|nr:hypothetical protein [Pyrinomonadaceae bacterium]
MNIAQNLKLFDEGLGKNKGRHADERSASFDYSFNYFQSFREKDKIEELAEPSQMEVSCLQLGFYLASWGMLRGSSFLLQKSLRFYQPLIRTLATFDKRVWAIDADSYDNENIEMLLHCRDEIVDALGRAYKPSDTLATKIMLGVFGNVPAFDDFFRKGLRVRSFGKASLEHIANFYKDNESEIDNAECFTIDYVTAEMTQRKYTKAKIIDMVGNIEGVNKTLQKQGVRQA